MNRMGFFKFAMPVIWLMLAMCWHAEVHGGIVVTGDVQLDQLSGLFHYSYTIAGVDAGRKVTGLALEVLANDEQPEYLPLSWVIECGWVIVPASSGPPPYAGFGWWSLAVGADHALLEGGVAAFFLVTHYAPRLGAYVITENAVGMETDYQHIVSEIDVPNYDGSFVETLWVGQDTMAHCGNASVPEPSSLAIWGTAIGLACVVRRLTCVAR